MSKRLQYGILVVMAFTCLEIFPIVIGSETAVSVEPAPTFPAADTDNTMLGFAWFKNGFTLQDSTTSCTFNSVYPVSGSVDMRSGTLYLSQDLIFKNLAELLGLGTIVGNEHLLEISPTITWIPATTNVLEDVTLVFNSDLLVSNTLTIKGNCTLYGNNNSLVVGSGAAIIIDSSANLTLRNMNVENISGSELSCIDDSGSLILDNVLWYQDADLTWENGAITFVNDVELLGTHTFSYESSQTSTVSVYSKLTISDGMHFELGRKEAVDFVEPLAFVDKTSVIKMDNCSLLITGSGIGLTNGVMEFNRDVTIEMVSSNTFNGAIVGNGIADQDMIFQFDSGANVYHNSGYFVFNNASPVSTQSSSQDSKYVRGVNSRTYVLQDLRLSRITVQLESLLVPPMEVAPGKTVLFDRAMITLPYNSFEITGQRYDSFTYLLRGNESIFVSKGVMPIAVLAAGPGNGLRGNGSLGGPLVLADSNAEIICDISGELASSVVLNGGTVTMQGDLCLCSADSSVTGSGTINLGDNVLRMSAQDSMWTSSVIFIGDGAVIELNSQISLSSTTTLQGTITINGGGNTFDLTGPGKLYIAPNSTITFKDIKILNASAGELTCLSDTSKLIFDDVVWIQDSDFTFDTGSILFRNQVDFVGTVTFLYSSSQTSTIDNKSEVSVSNGMTFAIGRQSVGAIEPLYFTNNTARLTFDDSTFKVTSGGIHLLHGTMKCIGNVGIDVNSTSTLNGFHFGDGNPANDLVLELDPGAILNVVKGHWVLENGAINNIKSVSSISKVVRKTPSVFYLKTDFEVPAITLDTSFFAVSIFDPGKVLTFKDSVVAISGNEFGITGSRYDAVTQLLAGNQFIFVQRGVYPAFLRVQGTGNTLQGNGDVVGAVTLVDSASQLIWNLQGVLKSNMTMNGGTLTVNSDMECGRGVKLVGTGKVVLGTNTFRLGSKDLAWTSDTYWAATDGVVSINSDMTMSSKMTFSGNCRLDGNRHILDLQSTGTIAVEAGSTLYLKDITIRGIAGSNVFCVDDAGKLIFDNVVWDQDANTTFTLGSLELKRRARFTGENTKFAYMTDKTCTIDADTNVTLDVGVTFSYDPAVASKDLLLLTDDTSFLILNGSTLHATVTGMRLRKGNLQLGNNSTIENETLVLEDLSLLDEGITLGDDTAANDCTLRILRGNQLTVAQGSLVYRNVSPQSIIIESQLATLNMLDGTALKLYETMDFGLGTVNFYDNTVLGRASGADLYGSINVFGNLSYVSL